jgi:hypothetical protein
LSDPAERVVGEAQGRAVALPQARAVAVRILLARHKLHYSSIKNLSISGGPSLVNSA